MSNINIIISGKTCTGKSAVAKLISDALANAGLSHEVDDGTDGDYGKYQTDKLHSLSLKKDFLVKVKTQTYAG